MEALAGLVKQFLPGTLIVFLAGTSLGAVLLWLPGRAKRAGAVWITALVALYWGGSVPVLADLLATRFHARNAGLITIEEIRDARAIVVLGAGIRTHYRAGGRLVAIPDPQTVYNAVEAARIYALVPGGLPVLASGGRQSEGAGVESDILEEWLIQGGVPAARIMKESGSRNTREQAQLVAPILKARGWSRFVLITPAVQGPRAAAVFQREGVEPIPAAAPYSASEEGTTRRWRPQLGALRVTERATYDYLAWAYYWIKGWL